MKTGSEIIEKFYLKYEYLAKKYANSLENFDRISFEREDLEQEFKIKIFLSIKSYGIKWGQYRRGECPRPVALKYYIETACANKRKDFMKYIERENGKCSIDDVNYDYGVSDDSRIDVSTNTFIVHDIDLLEGLDGLDKCIYSLFLRGYNKRFLSKVYNSKANGSKQEAMQEVERIIEGQKEYLLKKYGNQLTEKTQMFESYQLDD